MELFDSEALLDGDLESARVTDEFMISCVLNAITQRHSHELLTLRSKGSEELVGQILDLIIHVGVNRVRYAESTNTCDR